MPTFQVSPIATADDCDIFWVYAIDDFDACHQIASTLLIDATNESLFDAKEIPHFEMPLLRILHSSGEWTEVAVPIETAKDY